MKKLLLKEPPILHPELLVDLVEPLVDIRVDPVQVEDPATGGVLVEEEEAPLDHRDLLPPFLAPTLNLWEDLKMTLELAMLLHEEVDSVDPSEAILDEGMQEISISVRSMRSLKKRCTSTNDFNEFKELNRNQSMKCPKGKELQNLRSISVEYIYSCG